MAIPTYTEEQRKKLLKKARAAGFRSLSEVTQFQQAYGIKEDGDVGGETKKTLAQAREKHGNKSISELIKLETKVSEEKKQKDPVNLVKKHSQQKTAKRNINADTKQQSRAVAASDNTKNTQAVVTAERKATSVREKQELENTKDKRDAKVANISSQSQSPISLTETMPELFGNPIVKDWNDIILSLDSEERQKAEDARYIQLIRSMPGFQSNLSDEDILVQKDINKNLNDIYTLYKNNDVKALQNLANYLNLNIKSNKVIDLYKGISQYLASQKNQGNTYEPKLKDTSKSGKTGLVCNTPECAQYANDELRAAGYNTWNSAWNRTQSGDDFVIIGNGFDNIEKPSVYNEEQVKANNRQSVQNLSNNFDITTLDPNQIYSVGLTYYDSSHTKDSYDNGINNFTNTHTGNMYFDDETNSWRINHNIGSNIYDDDAFDLIYNINNPLYGVSTISLIPKPSQKQSTISTFKNKIYDVAKEIFKWVH